MEAGQVASEKRVNIPKYQKILPKNKEEKTKESMPFEPGCRGAGKPNTT